MSASDERRGAATAAALRREFDRSFAVPERLGRSDTIDILGLRVGGDAYAVRLADIAALLVDCKLAPLPTVMSEFLGVVGMRGAVIPAWSLGALLGYGRDEAQPRWMVLVGERGGQGGLALAFEGFDGYLRVGRAEVADLAAGEAPATETGRYVRQSVRVGGSWRGVLALQAIMTDVERRLDAGRARLTVGPDGHHPTTKKR